MNSYFELFNEPNKFAEKPGFEEGLPGLVYGYQRFYVASDFIEADSSDEKLIKKKLILKQVLDSLWFNNKTVLDIGANAGFFSIFAALKGAKEVTAIDMDKEYIELFRRIQNFYNFKNIKILNENLLNFNERSDLVLAFAMVHWLYSCTADYGNLNKVIAKLSSLTNDILLIEWIEPNDNAIQFFKHIEFNKEIITGPYNKESFEEALKIHFYAFKPIEFISSTRILYLAVKRPEIIQQLQEQKGFFDFWEFFSELNENDYQYLILKNWDLFISNIDFFNDSTIEILADENTIDSFDIYFTKVKQIVDDKFIQYSIPITLNNKQLNLNIKIIKLTSNYIPISFQRQLLQNKQRNKSFYTISSNDLALYSLFSMIYHKGVASNNLINVFEELSIITKFQIPPDKLPDFSYITKILNDEDIILKDYNSLLDINALIYLYPPENVINSRILDDSSNKIYQSRVYLINNKIIKQSNENLAVREYNFLKNFNSTLFPKVYNLDYDDKNNSFFEMEFIEGYNLQNFNQFHSELNESEKDNFYKELLNILKELFNNKIIHRDINPKNIIVRNKKPVLIDFGWAIKFDEEFYTPQGLGENYAAPDKKNDIYSMGKIISELDKDNKFEKLSSTMINLYNSVEIKNIDKLFEIYEKIIHNKSNKPNPLVTIIIPCHNNLNLTKQCISSIYENTPLETFNLIAIDNNSSDGTQDYFNKLKSKYNNFKFIRNNQNLTFAKANNNIVKIANTDLILFLNNDTIVTKNWLNSLIDEINSDKNIAAVGSLLLYPDTELIQHCGVKLGTFQGKKLFYHIHQLRNYKYIPHSTNTYELNFITAACMLTKKEIFEKVNSFDENYQNGFEDIDLCLKFKENNYKIKYCGKSIVYHYESQTEGRNDHNEENYQLLLTKWNNKLVAEESEQESAINLMDIWLRTDLKKETNNKEIIEDLLKIAQIRNCKQEIQEFESLLKNINDSSLKKSPATNFNIKASIIIPVFNNLSFTQTCIRKIEENTPNIYELIIINNNSSDGTYEYLENLKSQKQNLKIIHNKENLGFAKACNLGAKQAEGNILVFLNNDVEVELGWLEKAIEKFENNENIGIIGAKLLYPDRTIQHCGIYFERTPGTYLVWGQHSHRNKPETAPEVNYETEPDAVTGACLFIKKEIFQKVNGFDESYPMYFEDTDLCFKVREIGYKIIYSPEITAIHYEAQTIKNQAKINELNINSSKIFYQKWYKQVNSLLFNTLIEKQVGNFVYLKKDFIPDFNNQAQIEQFVIMMLSHIPFYAHFGGVGDALLLLTTFYDEENNGIIFSFPGNLQTMENFFKKFPNLKIYFVPWENNYYTEVYFRAIFPKLNNFKGMGITPENWNNELEWNSELNIFEKYKIKANPDWAKEFKTEKITEPQVIIAPKGSLIGMPTWKKNKINPDWFQQILNYLKENKITPIIIGTPDESQEYPVDETCIDKRSYDFREQMQLIASSDLCIAADSWHKTFAALCGINTIVFQAQRTEDFKNIQDSSEFVFIKPWRNLKLVRNINEFKIIFRKLFFNEDIPSNIFLPCTSLSKRFWTTDYNKIKTVLLKCPPAIGDALNLTAIVRSLKEQFPHLIISVSGNNLVGEIFLHNPDVNGFVITGSQQEFAVESISDKTVDYNNIIARLPEYYNRMPFIDILGNLAGVKVTNKNINYFIQDDEIIDAKEILKDFKNKNLVGIHLISTKDIYRSYPHRKNLIIRLINEDFAVVNFGKEKVNFEHPGFYDCASNNLTLRQQIAIASLCNSFITIDSAFFHLAHNYFNKPTLLIAGPTNPKLISNPDKKFIIVRNNKINCFNCYWSKACKIECMNNLSVDEILNKFSLI